MKIDERESVGVSGAFTWATNVVAPELLAKLNREELVKRLGRTLRAVVELIPKNVRERVNEMGGTALSATIEKLRPAGSSPDLDNLTFRTPEKDSPSPAEETIKEAFDGLQEDASELN